MTRGGNRENESTVCLHMCGVRASPIEGMQPSVREQQTKRAASGKKEARHRSSGSDSSARGPPGGPPNTTVLSGLVSSRFELRIRHVVPDLSL